MSTWANTKIADKSYHEKAMERFSALHDDPTSILYWDFPDQATLVVALVFAVFAFTMAVQGFWRRKKDANSEIPLSSPLTYFCVGLFSLSLPYLWTF